MLGAVGLCAGLAASPAPAADPAGFPALAMEMQQPMPQAPTPAAPPTTTAPATPGAPAAPAAPPAAPTLAPVTDVFQQAPRTSTMAAPGFQPFMIGDQLGGVVRTSTPTPSNPLLARPGGVVGAIAQAGRGAFKITDNESPRPVDRVFFNYNYFNRVGTGVPDSPIFDIHRETFGFEKTFLDGDASVALRVSTAQRAGGVITDDSLGPTDFAGLTFISKFALINDRVTGNVFSTGLAVSVPTTSGIPMPTGSGLNPTLLQPYTGFIYNFERFYTQGFTSLTVPTDSRDVTLLTNSIAVGYYLYRAPYPEDVWISYLVPTIEGHSTTPLNHRGSDSFPIGFPDLFVLTNGLHIGVGRSSNLTVGMAVPLTGPKLYNFEAFAQLNWRF
jgi:hypothetical protein